MGALDRRIGLDHASDEGLTHALRLRADRSCDGTGSRAVEHVWVDFHSHLDGETWVTDDVPVTAADKFALRLCGKLLDEREGSAGLDAARDVMIAVWGADVVNRLFAIFSIDGDDIPGAVAAYRAILSAYA